MRSQYKAKIAVPTHFINGAFLDVAIGVYRFTRREDTNIHCATVRLAGLLSVKLYALAGCQIPAAYFIGGNFRNVRKEIFARTRDKRVPNIRLSNYAFHDSTLLTTFPNASRVKGVVTQANVGYAF